MAFDFEFQIGISQHDSGNSRQALTGCGFKCVLASVEKNVGHADDQSAIRIFGFEHLVQLLEQAFAHCFFLPDGFIGGEALFLGFGLG